MLKALCENEGAKVQDFGFCRDSFDQIKNQIEIIAQGGFDLLITTGGASVGDHDYTKPVLESLGAKLAIWKIALRPGETAFYLPI